MTATLAELLAAREQTAEQAFRAQQAATAILIRARAAGRTTITPDEATEYRQQTALWRHADAVLCGIDGRIRGSNTPI